eukprot:PhM_4_TR16844/c0_g1_i1/m.43258
MTTSYSAQQQQQQLLDDELALMDKAIDGLTSQLLPLDNAPWKPGHTKHRDTSERIITTNSASPPQQQKKNQRQIQKQHPFTDRTVDRLYREDVLERKINQVMRQREVIARERFG